MTPRRAIYLLSGSLFAVSLVLFGLLAEKQRRDAFAETDRVAQSLAETLAGHAERLLDASNLVANVAILYSMNRSWDEIYESQDSHVFFQRFIEQYEYIEALWLTDANGMPRLTSRQFPAPQVDTSDRDHFITLQKGGQDPYISGLLRSRVAPGSNIVFARRLNDENGAFRGIVQVILHPEYFYTFYAKIRPSYPVAISLIRDDLSMLVRYPRIPDDQIVATKKWPDRSPLDRDRNSGIIRVASPVDGVMRVEAYERVPRFPVLVTVGIAVADVHRRWLGTIGEQAIFAAVALAALLYLMHRALQGLQREEVAVDALRTLTATQETRIAARTAELGASNSQLTALLTEKERLLREVNHRIKNSLQMISSLLDLQGRTNANPAVSEQLSQASRRVLAVARVHQRLYSSQNVETLEFAAYLRALCADLGTSLAIEGSQVRIQVDAEEHQIDADVAIPLGLVVSEAVANAAKHAYRDGNPGTVDVAFRTLDGGNWQLVVADHGVGLPELSGVKRAGGLGMQLIEALSAQIDAMLEIQGNDGTKVTVTGPAASVAAAVAADAS